MQKERLAAPMVKIAGERQEIYLDGKSVGILVLAVAVGGLRYWVWRPDHLNNKDIRLQHGVNMLSDGNGTVAIARVNGQILNLTLRGKATLDGPPTRQKEVLIKKVEERQSVPTNKTEQANPNQEMVHEHPQVFDLDALREAARSADAYQNRKVWWRPWTWF